MEWVRASYNKSDIQARAFITTLKPVESRGVYNVFQASNGDFVVVFSNQKGLLDYINDNIGSVFAIRFLQENHSYYSYTREIGGELMKVTTLASASVLIPGTPDEPRNMYYEEVDGLLTII